MRFLLCLLSLLFSAPVLAHGYLVEGKHPSMGTVVGKFVFGPAGAATRDVALRQCNAEAVECKITYEFEEKCAVSLLAKDRTLLTATAATIDKGLRIVLPRCTQHGGCLDASTGCDPNAP